MVDKLQWIQVLRALAVLLVLLSHLFRIDEKYSADVLLDDWALVGKSGVDLFFVISGFIMVMVTEGRREGFRRAAVFLYRRLLRIYPVYWFYTTIVLVVYLLRPGMVNSGEASSIWGSYLLWPSDSPFLVAVGWTLVYEVYFYLVFALLFFLPRSFLVGGLLVWAGFVLVLSFWSEAWSVWARCATNPLVYEFIFGALLAIFCLKNAPKISLVTSLGLVILAIITVFWGGEWYLFTEGDTPKGWWRVLVFGVPSVVLVYAAYAMDFSNVHAPRWLVLAGDSSYSTYLSHVMVLSVLGYFWVWIGRYFALSSLWVLPFMVVACFVYGWVSYRFIEKPLLRMGKKVVLE